MRRILAVAFVSLVLGVSWLQACTTPVYRYAMYNWLPEPYRVFYFHHGKPAKEDDAVNRKITALAEAIPPLTNLVLEPVDLTKHPPEELPEPLRKAWAAQKDKSQPKHFVVTPWGVELSGGRLDPATVDALVDSPARRRMAEMLDQGQVAILVFLTGDDEAENRRAEKAAAELIARAAAGELLGEMEPVFGATEEERDGKARGLELGLIKLSRTDPAEKWLVRLLTSIEPDLSEGPLASQPMVFAVYGRGRAMPPYVGKGITTENLTELILFLNGACSCQVKDANPGMDLLVHWDWEATAERLAASEYSADQFQPEYAEFAVNMPEQPASTAEKSEETQAEQTAPASKDIASTTPQPSARPSSVRPDAGATVAVPTVTIVPETARSSTSRAMGRLGIGLAAVAVAVILAGLILVRKRNA